MYVLHICCCANNFWGSPIAIARSTVVAVMSLLELNEPILAMVMKKQMQKTTMKRNDWRTFGTWLENCKINGILLLNENDKGFCFLSCSVCSVHSSSVRAKCRRQKDFQSSTARGAEIQE